MSEASLANLKISHCKPEARTVHASARLKPTSKEDLQEKLNQLKMSLADFLEVVADSEIEVIKSENNQKVVVKAK